MKTFTLFFSLLLFSAESFSQTNVDRISRTLDSLITIRFDNWKASQDLKTLKVTDGDPAKPGYIDAQWQTIVLDQKLYYDSCWFRKTIILPEKILGEPVKGSVRFITAVDDYGFMWINGESKGSFLWNGDFELTPDAKPGQSFSIVILAVNTGGPLRLIQAELEASISKLFRQSIADLSLSLRVGQRLLSFDSYQENPYSGTKIYPGIDKSEIPKKERQKLNELLQSLAGQINTGALAEGRIDDFKKSLSEVRPKLQPINEFAKKFTLSFVSNAHIDAAWLWRENETIMVAKNTFTSVLNMMDSRPDFTYTQSAAAYYDWMEKLYPDIFSRIKQRIKDKRWEAIGGLWIEPDCNMPSGESWSRQLLYAQRYFLNTFGFKTATGWNPDSFGYNWNMPQFYRNAGIDAFITQKIGWNDTNVFPHRVFWWEAPDGSRILTYFPFSYTDNIDEPYGIVDWLRQFEANTGFSHMMVLFGVGDHGGGPTIDMLERIDRMKRYDIFPSIRFTTAGDYISYLKKQDLEKIPVWRDELYLEYHRATLTTQAETKKHNRINETLLTNAEKFSLFSSLNGGAYNGADLTEAWKHVLFNQFHDILPGSSIREVYVDAAERYAKSEEIGSFELKKSLHNIASAVSTEKITDGIPVIVFNPLSWKRSEAASLELPSGDTSGYTVTELNGREIPSQIEQTGKHRRQILFDAADIPPLGYKSFVLKKQKPSPPQNGMLTVSKNSLENDIFRVTIGPDSGWVQSIIDKRSNREILAGFGNYLHVMEDKPKQWDAWNLGWTGRYYPTTLRSIEVLSSGPVKSTIRITRDMLGPSFQRTYPAEGFPSSFFIQDITLYRNSTKIDFTTEVDWWEEKTMLKAAFPLAVNDTVATFEIPYGHIERSTQMRNSFEIAKKEVSGHRWADLSQKEFGVSLLNRSKYGHDIRGNLMRLSLLRSPKWPDPTADRGKHKIEYALYPHSGGWREAGTVQRGYEYNYPLLAVTADSHAGTLPSEYSFMRVSPVNVVITSVKKSEDSDAWIVQMYETEGKETQASLFLPSTPKKAMLSNFLEEDGIALFGEKNLIPLQLKKNQAVTVKVEF